MYWGAGKLFTSMVACDDESHRNPDRDFSCDNLKKDEGNADLCNKTGC